MDSQLLSMRYLCSLLPTPSLNRSLTCSSFANSSSDRIGRIERRCYRRTRMVWGIAN